MARTVVYRLTEPPQPEQAPEAEEEASVEEEGGEE